MNAQTEGFTLLKLQILAVLCFLTAGSSLLLQYSRTVLHEEYSTVEVILMAEVFKMFVSGYIAVQALPAGKWLIELWTLFTTGKEMLVLVVLYSISNISGFNALPLIGAAWHSVLVQLKILTTALFAVCFLRRKYSSTKWRSLILLVTGAVLVTSPVFNKCEKSEDQSLDNTEIQSIMLGVILVLTQATISGFSAVYFEKVLKKEGPQPSIWDRNFQLATYSVIVLVATGMIHNMRDIVLNPAKHGQTPFSSIFSGWSMLTVLITIMNGSTGLVIAATLKYADAVLKCLATSCAIIVTSVVGYFFFDSVIDIFVSIGMVSVIVAVFNYTLDATPPPPLQNAESASNDSKV